MAEHPLSIFLTSLQDRLNKLVELSNKQSQVNKALVTAIKKLEARIKVLEK